MAQKILIIDEEQNNLDLLHDCLHKAGFKVLTVKEGSTALQQVNQIKPGVLNLSYYWSNFFTLVLSFPSAIKINNLN